MRMYPIINKIPSKWREEMITKSKNGLLIVLESLRFIKKNPKGLFFPLLISLFIAIIITAFIIPLWNYDSGFKRNSPEHWQKAIWHYLSIPEESLKDIESGEDIHGIALFRFLFSFLTLRLFGYIILVWFVLNFTIIFLNIAFIKFTLDKLHLRETSIRASLLFSLSRWKVILSWSLISGIIGSFIQFAEQHLNFIGRRISKIIGIGWALAVFLVLPVLVQENVSVRNGLRRSGQLFKNTWGERVTTNFIIGALFGFLWFLGVIIIFTLIDIVDFLPLSYHLNDILSNLGFVAIFALLVSIGICRSAISVILQSILYCYATEGVVPHGIDKNLLDRLWKVK